MPELLNPQHEKIVHMLVAGNTKVAIAAALGIRREQVFRALSREEVKARIVEVTGEAIDAMDINVDMIVQGFAEIAYADPADVGTKTRLHALELLGKWRGMFVVKTEDVTDRGQDAWVNMRLEIAKEQENPDAFLE